MQSGHNSNSKACKASHDPRVLGSPLDFVNVNTINSYSGSGAAAPSSIHDESIPVQQEDELLQWLQADSWEDTHNDRSCCDFGNVGPLKSSINTLPIHPELVLRDNISDPHQSSTGHFGKHQKFGLVPNITVPSTSRISETAPLGYSPSGAVPSSPPPVNHEGVMPSISRHNSSPRNPNIDSRFAVVPNLSATPQHVCMSNGNVPADGDCSQVSADKSQTNMHKASTQPRRSLNIAGGNLFQPENASSRQGDEESAVSTQGAFGAILGSSFRTDTSTMVDHQMSYEPTTTWSFDGSESYGPSKVRKDDTPGAVLPRTIMDQRLYEWSLGGLEGSSWKCRKDGSTVLKRKLSDITDSEYQSSQDPDSGVINGKNLISTPPSAQRSRCSENHNHLERRRRNKIKEKMKALQDLIPNSTKTDKASMLDEAIAYMKLLQQKIQTMACRSGMELPPVLLPQGMQNVQMAGAFPQIGLNNMGMGMGMGMGMNLGMVDMNGNIVPPVYPSTYPSMQRMILPSLGGSTVSPSQYQAGMPFTSIMRPGMLMPAYQMLVPIMIPPPSAATLKCGGNEPNVGMNGRFQHPNL